MDPEEFERERGLRDANIPLASSGFIELLPSIEPHAGRDIWGKVGGLATAVMRLVGQVEDGESRVVLESSCKVRQPSSIHPVTTTNHRKKSSRWNVARRSRSRLS